MGGREGGVGVDGDFSFFATFGTGVRGLDDVLRGRGTSTVSCFGSGSGLIGNGMDMGGAGRKVVRQGMV